MARGTDAGTEVVPRLVVTSAGPLEGEVLRFEQDDLLIGRGTSVDLQLDDPSVSRVHARFHRGPSGMLVDDLGSSGGTTVNGVRIADAAPVRPGDVVAFASVETRYEDPTATSSAAARARATTLQPPSERGRAVNIGSQHAHQINMVEGDQQIGDRYIQQITYERESLLEDLSTLRSRGRRLVIAGFILSIAGFSLYAYALLRFITRFDEFGPNTQFSDVQLFGQPVFGIPIGIIGFAAFGIGSVLLIVGIVTHVMAAGRRRAWNREHPQADLQVRPGARR